MEEIFNKILRKKIINSNCSINESAMYDLIMRVTGNRDYADKFSFSQIAGEKSDYDFYTMYDHGDKIIIEATSGVCAASAFNRYLREYCHCYFGPITSNIKLPSSPPSLGKVIDGKSPFVFKYFLNYCTFSYSLLFADWNTYERLTDWMLLSGINIYLNVVGHEIVWLDMLMELGYSESEAVDFLCGPACLPWQWMGNMSHFGGKLPPWWFDNQKQLGNKINDKMRMFGAEPIMPGFFGMVPQDFKEKQPESNPVCQGMWCDSFEQPYLLMPDDRLFETVADIFYNKTLKHFGDIHYFSGDPFHEGGNTNGFDLERYGKEIINLMKKHTSDSMWFLQGWTGTPRREMLKAMNPEDVVVISLAADKNYSVCDNFGGFAWIYSSTTSFGGGRIMDGYLNSFMHEPYDALQNRDITLVGIGMTMEGIELDEILYEGISYNAFNEEKTDKMKFLSDYTTARYGYSNENIINAFCILWDDIFKFRDSSRFNGRESGLCSAPSLEVKSVSSSSEAFDVRYDEKNLCLCRDLLKKEFENLKNNECYMFDITDIERQINANKSWHIIYGIISSFKNGNRLEFEKCCGELMNLYDLQENTVCAIDGMRLDKLIDRARSYGRTNDEKMRFAFDAVNMIMLWSGYENPPVLMDYAHREWYGMLSYYKKRWAIFINLMRLNFETPENLQPIDWRSIALLSTLEIISESDGINL